MKYEAALAAALEGNPEPVYFFHGKEGFFSAEFVRALCAERFTPAERDLNYHEFDSDHFSNGEVSVSEILDLARTVSLFSRGRIIVAHIDHLVARPNRAESDERKARREGEIGLLLKYAADPTPGVVIVLTANSVDRRLRTYKQLASKVTAVSCDPLKGWELSRWIQERAQREGYRMSRDAAEFLSDVLQNELTLVASELDKIITYAGDNHRIDLDMVQQVASSSLQTDIFGLVDALSNGDAEEACAYIRGFIVSGAPVPYILYMIGRQFRLTWQIKLLRDRGEGQQQIRSYLELHPYVVRKTMAQANNFSYEALETAFELILEADVGLKTGRWEDQLGLELLAVKLASESRAVSSNKAKNL